MNENYYSMLPLKRIFRKNMLELYKKEHSCFAWEIVYNFVSPPPQSLLWSFFVSIFTYFKKTFAYALTHKYTGETIFWTEKPKSKIRVTNIFNDELDLTFPSFASFPPFKT